MNLFINDCFAEDLPRSRPPPELPPRSPTSAEATPSLPPNQPDLLRQISAQAAPQPSSEGKITNAYCILSFTTVLITTKKSKNEVKTEFCAEIKLKP